MEKINVEKLIDLGFVEIPNYQGYYISKKGEVYSNRGRFELSEPKLLKQGLQNGYPSVALYKTGNKGSKGGTKVYIHRLLALAFIPQIEGKDCVNHIDGNKLNNNLNNLEWVTKAENNLHAFKTGLMKQTKYTKEQSLEVLKRYHVKGQKQTEISKEMNVPINFVNDLISRGTNIKSQGLGDDIEKLLNSNLLKPLTEKVKKLIWKDSEDCNCDERKEKLNNLIPYRKKVNCLNESDYNQLTEFLKPTKGSLTPNEQWAIAGIYERVFSVKLESSNCASCWRDTLGELRKVYNEYKVND